jgi:hypothetical protein
LSGSRLELHIVHVDLVYRTHATSRR